MWGVIKKLIIRDLSDPSMHFGFISPEGMAKDLFFRGDELVGMRFDELRVGDVVSFETEETPKGLRAVAVQRNGGPKVQKAIQLVTPDEPEIEVIRTLDYKLIRRLMQDPNDLRQLHPKVFEDLIMEIFANEGFEAELVGSWNQADGGVDIIAVRKDFGGLKVKYAIQCKQYSAERRVSADPIRQLAGVLDRFQAHVGVVATTSHFTEAAKQEAEVHLWKIGLRDYDNLVASLSRLKLI